VHHDSRSANVLAVKYETPGEVFNLSPGTGCQAQFDFDNIAATGTTYTPWGRPARYI
jgi:hypothetical protein